MLIDVLLKFQTEDVPFSILLKLDGFFVLYCRSIIVELAVILIGITDIVSMVYTLQIC